MRDSEEILYSSVKLFCVPSLCTRSFRSPPGEGKVGDAWRGQQAAGESARAGCGDNCPRK